MMHRRLLLSAAVAAPVVLSGCASQSLDGYASEKPVLDLALPSALLAGVIAAEGDSGQHEGAYFGWWNFATKLNLALAAGLALPLLGWWGYTPGTRSADGLHTLGLAYAVLPCALKLAAATALYGLVLRRPRSAATV